MKKFLVKTGIFIIALLIAYFIYESIILSETEINTGSMTSKIYMLHPITGCIGLSLLIGIRIWYDICFFNAIKSIKAEKCRCNTSLRSKVNFAWKFYLSVIVVTNVYHLWKIISAREIISDSSSFENPILKAISVIVMLFVLPLMSPMDYFFINHLKKGFVTRGS